MNEIIIYQTADNRTQIDVKFEEETVWLTRKQIAVLFDKNVMNINEHSRTEDIADVEHLEKIIHLRNNPGK